MTETPAARAIRDALRDPVILQKLRQIFDEAEACGECSTEEADVRRAQIAAIEVELEQRE